MCMRDNQQGRAEEARYEDELTDTSVTHLHNDTIPKIGGDTLWA